MVDLLSIPLLVPDTIEPDIVLGLPFYHDSVYLRFPANCGGSELGYHGWLVPVSPFIIIVLYLYHLRW